MIAVQSVCIYTTATSMPFKLTVRVSQAGLIWAIKVTHTRWKPLCLSLSLCVFSDPVNVCVLSLTWRTTRMSDHRGDDVRPPEMLRTTTWERERGEERSREVRREKLSVPLVSVTESHPCRKCFSYFGVRIWNLDSGSGTDPTFHVVHHWTMLLSALLTTRPTRSSLSVNYLYSLHMNRMVHHKAEVVNQADITQ